MKITKHSNSGFTIIELMLTVLIASILLAVALPNLSAIVASNRLSAQTNSIVASLNFARSETVNRDVDVRVEPITSGLDWKGGWLVRIDGNNDNDFGDAEDTVLKYFDAIKNGSLASTVQNVTYEPDGNITAISAFTLTPTICKGKGVRQVTVSITGHARATKQDCP